MEGEPFGDLMKHNIPNCKLMVMLKSRNVFVSSSCLLECRIVYAKFIIKVIVCLS